MKRKNEHGVCRVFLFSKIKEECIDLKKEKSLFLYMVLISLFVLGFSNNVAEASSNEHVVSQGETLWRISYNNGVSPESVLSANGRSEGDITVKAGETLIIPSASSSASSASVVNTSADTADLSFIYRVVQQEGGGDYNSARWVSSTMMNRKNSPLFPGQNSLVEVAKADGQFESVWAGHIWRSHNDTIHPNVKQAVQDTINYGAVHDYLFFWGADYAAQKGRAGVNVGGNVYFNGY